MYAMTTLQQRLKTARLEARLSQEQLAKAAGISQPTLSDLENKPNTKSKHIAVLAHALGVRPYWLATGKGQKKEIETLRDSLERDLIEAFREIDSPELKRSLILQVRALKD